MSPAVRPSPGASTPAKARQPARRRVPRGEARGVLIAAAHRVVRRRGFAASSVEDICAAAGVTKGAFFHHFASKEALAVAAAEAWTERAAPLFSAPPHTRLPDPLDRVMGHIDMRLAMLDGPVEDVSCFVGTMVQEAYASSDAIRAACEASIDAYCHALAPDFAAAIVQYGAPEDVTAIGLARHVQAVLQGGFVLAKTKGDLAHARESVIHLKRYIDMLFQRGRS